MAEVSRDTLLEKLKGLKRGVDVIVLKEFPDGSYVGVTAKDFADMLNWIMRGKVVEEAVVGYAENGSPIVERRERDPTPEEVKRRWLDSGYVKVFEEWLSKGIISKEDLKKWFGSEKPWV